MMNVLITEMPMSISFFAIDALLMTNVFCHQVKSSVNKLFSLGSVSVRYTPKTTGAHELNILHKGAPLQVKNNWKKKFC